MPGSIKVTGGKETARALELLGRKSAQAKVLRQSLRPGARNYVLLARAKAPVASGLYRRSIAVGVLRSPGPAAHLMVGIRGPRRRISHILEFGSRFQAAQPHMRPAAREGAQDAIKLFGSTIWPLIAKEATRVAVRRSVRGR